MLLTRTSQTIDYISLYDPALDIGAIDQEAYVLDPRADRLTIRQGKTPIKWVLRSMTARERSVIQGIENPGEQRYEAVSRCLLEVDPWPDSIPFRRIRDRLTDDTMDHIPDEVVQELGIRIMILSKPPEDLEKN